MVMIVRLSLRSHCATLVHVDHEGITVVEARNEVYKRNSFSTCIVRQRIHNCKNTSHVSTGQKAVYSGTYDSPQLQEASPQPWFTMFWVVCIYRGKISFSRVLTSEPGPTAIILMIYRLFVGSL